MLRNINNLFFSYKTDKFSFKKTTLKSKNATISKLFIYFYKSSMFVFQPFKSVCINIYTVFLQSDRLNIKILPNIFQKFIIIFSNQENLSYFFYKSSEKNIKYLRKNNFKYLNKLWTLYFYENLNFYNELNLNRSSNSEISNFFYKTNNIIPNQKKFILFYFFNKIVFNQYPYFYWIYVNSNINLNKTLETKNDSQHLRTQLIFIFVEFFNNFDRTNVSYLKLSLTTFKSISNFLITNKSKLNFFLNKNINNSTISTKNVKVDDLLNYFTLFENLNTKKHKNADIYTELKNLIVIWYNKLHFTTLNTSKKTLILYLRSSRHFNKGRYSRNRQLYRTGVYWCIWLNVVIVYGLHYYFYRVVFSFGYLWLPLCVMILSIFSSRLYKYRYYNFNQIMIEFKEYNKFIYLCFLKLQLQSSMGFKNTILNLKLFLTNYLPLFISLFNIKK